MKCSRTARLMEISAENSAESRATAVTAAHPLLLDSSAPSPRAESTRTALDTYTAASSATHSRPIPATQVREAPARLMEGTRDCAHMIKYLPLEHPAYVFCCDLIYKTQP